MQDRSIDNALLALRKQGGQQGKLAEVLLEMRGIDVSMRYQERPAKRGETARFVLSMLKSGPKTCPEITDALDRPDIRRSQKLQRVYMALVRLEAKGMVRREGRVWAVDSESVIL